MSIHEIDCKVLAFDAGNTLIIQTPSTESVVASFLGEELGIECDDATVKRCIYTSELWAGEQGDREVNGAPRISDEAFISGMYGAGIRAVARGLSDEELEYHAPRLGEALASRRWIARESAAPVLQELSTRGYTLALVSNFSSELRNILGENGLDHFFRSIVISDEAGIRKPDPRIMEPMFEELAASAESCLYIGDHPYDVICAKSAGMHACWLNPDSQEMPGEIGAKPDIEIGSLEELLR